MERKRRNLGLRVSEDEHRRLREVAEARRTSVQQLFGQMLADLTSNSTDETPLSDGTLPADHWPALFLKALPGVAVIKHAGDLSIAWVNEGYTLMTGEPLEALIGKRVGQIWATRESAELIEQNDNDALTRGCATVAIEYVKDRRWGTDLRRLRIRFPIRGRDGKPRYLGAIGFDYDKVITGPQRDVEDTAPVAN